MSDAVFGKSRGGVEMVTRRRYPRPPIIESLSDIQVSYEQGSPPLAALEELGDRFRKEYPIREPLHSFEIGIDPQRGTAVHSKQEVVGYRYWNESRDQVVQFRRDGFMFSRIPSATHPYDEWEVTLREMQRLWPAYARQLKPTQIRRLAVRYINRIDLPAGRTELGEFFLARPDLPDAIPLTVLNFVMRVVVPLPGLEGGFLALGQGTIDAPLAKPGSRSVLLDLDVFRQVNLSCSLDDTEVWESLESIHARENELFESFITDAARELFK